MNRSFLKLRARRLYRCAMNQVMCEQAEDELERSAIIFAPHQDDEVLGCGGTIIRKRAAGADVRVVFMTDGSSSHPHLSHLISSDELKAVRMSEALAAGRILGLEQSHVAFLAFRDGQVDENQSAAIQEIADIISHRQPDEVFIPYQKEPNSDHRATNTIVLCALQACKIEAIVYEYPVWFWHQWPWTSPLGTIRIGSLREILIHSLVSGLGMRLLKDFRCCVYIGGILERKRAALDQYKSQMTQFVPDPRWLTLGDVSHGEFLACFFQDHEVFRRYSLVVRY